MVGTAAGNIVAKCLGARPGTAAKGVECLLLFAEAECGDKVVVSAAASSCVFPSSLRRRGGGVHA